MQTQNTLGGDVEDTHYHFMVFPSDASIQATERGS